MSPASDHASAASVSDLHRRFIWPVRIYYEDTDAGGVVYHANYLRFMERARTEWLRALGHEQDELRDREGLVFAVQRVAIEYLKPARFNDRLSAVCELTQVGRVRLVFAQSLIREPAGPTCCRAEVTVACIDAATLRPARMPASLLASLQT